MKILITFAFLALSFCHVRGQGCDGQRYFDEIFDVDLTSDILYGEANQPTLFDSDATQKLFLDVYQPADDTLDKRPLIIWAFGGGFVFGSKKSPDIVNLSNAFSARGYINASIDYRLSSNLVVNSDSSNFYWAVMKATHDMAAAIRFFYKDALSENLYRVDTTKIYIGGVSAGAVAALHGLYLDEFSEIPPIVYDKFISNGGFAGNSGNSGYSQNFAGVINLCGALLDTALIDLVKTPVVSLHGTDDDILPYGSEVATVLNLNMKVDGSATIHQKLDELGVENELYSFYGAGHTPFILSPSAETYMDTTIQVIRNFLYNQVCEETTANNAVVYEEFSFEVFPNPSNGNLKIETSSGINQPLQLSILDCTGRELESMQLDMNNNSFDFSEYSSGIYFLKLFGKNLPQSVVKKVIFH